MKRPGRHWFGRRAGLANRVAIAFALISLVVALVVSGATYSGARTEQIEVGERQVEWTIADDTYRLHLVATRPEGAGLRAPTPAGMDRRIAETLNAYVDVRCTEIGTGRVIFAGTGRHAGLEVEGDLARLR